MTNKEAIDKLITLKFAQALQAKAFNEDGKPLDPDFETAVNMATEALEKQIPKKPIEKDGWISCPNCEISMSGRMYVPWCDNCGQALDWSEEE